MTTSHWWKHPTIFAAVIGAIGMMIVAIIQLTPLFLSLPKPGRFSYSVRVEMKDGRQIINNAKVSIIVGGKTPLIEFTDVNGFSIFSIETDYAGSHGILIVEASGFSVYTQNINIFPDKLPAVVQLEVQKQPSPTIEISSSGTAVAVISTEVQVPLSPTIHNESLTTSTVLPTSIPPTSIPPTSIPAPTNTVPVTAPPSSRILLGLWEWQGNRPPMPTPANYGQVIFANGDIDNSGTCHVKEFGPGVSIGELGMGRFQLWLITGTSEQIAIHELNIQEGSANDPNNPYHACSRLP